MFILSVIYEPIYLVTKHLCIYQALEEALIKDIPTMVDCLTKSGLDIPVDLDKLATPQLQVA